MYTLILLSFIILLSGCIYNNSSSQPADSDNEKIADGDGHMGINYDEIRENAMRNNNNLKGFDELAGKQNIQLLLDKVPYYPNNCREFVLEKKYSDFELTGVLEYEDIAVYSASYKLNSNHIQGAFNARVRVTIAQTANAAHAIITNFVNNSASMEIYSSSIEGILVGDLAVGDQDRLTFVRGNIYVDVIGYEGISITNLAAEIDQQILEIITKDR
jgi:hypothetical protein